MVPSFIEKFYQKHNLRPFETTWLLYVHVLAIIGLIYGLGFANNLKTVKIVVIVGYYHFCYFYNHLLFRSYCWIPSAMGS